MSTAIKLTRLRKRAQFEQRLQDLGVRLPIDPEIESDGPLSQPFAIAGREVGNRFCVLPMEGWDATADGRPTELVLRRWQRFGQSGAKLIWGGEAYAIVPEGRANPNQLSSNPETEGDLAELRAALVAAHEAKGESSSDLLIGLQLTHSGRYSRPDGSPSPRTAFRDPVLDARVGITSDAALLSDGELDELVGAYASLARIARNVGFDFVDIKACHGYLGHELLSAHERPGPYGGDLAGRSRFLLRAVEAVRREASDLAIGVRLSIFDLGPYQAGEDGVGRAQQTTHRAFGGGNGSVDLHETNQLLSLLQEAGVSLLCTTAGSPYYNPHSQRPAFYPPSDGYESLEDPLVGVARQVDATAQLKRQHPDLCIVGSAYTYLQEWLPRVAQAVVRQHGADFIGLGRMMLSYPELPRDVLQGAPIQRALVCRTFSDCTTAPRNGLVSGCYPFDAFYKRRPEADALAELKRSARQPRT